MMKQSFLCILLIFSFSQLSSQDTLVTKYISDGHFQRFKQLTDGEFITGGRESWGNVNPQFCKLDKNLNLSWSLTFADDLRCFIPQLVETNDGCILLTVNTSDHNSSYVILKLDKTNHILWQRNYFHTNGNPLTVYTVAPSAQGDNGFLFGISDCSLANYLGKCDADGQIEWGYEYSLNSRSGSIRGIIPEENSYVMCSTYDMNSVFLFRTDLKGDLIKSTSYLLPEKTLIAQEIVKLEHADTFVLLTNNNHSDHASQHIILFNDDLNLHAVYKLENPEGTISLQNIEASNDSTSFVLTGSCIQEGTHYGLLMSISINGNILWQHQVLMDTTITNTNSSITSVEVVSDTIYYLGYSAGSSFIGKTGSDGNDLCIDYPSNIILISDTMQVADPHISVTPYRQPSLDTTNHQPYHHILFDKEAICIANDDPSGDLGSDILSSGFVYYPNPVESRLYIRKLTNTPVTINIFGMDGQLWITAEHSHNEASIDVESLTPGHYILSIQIPGKTPVMKKLVKL